MTVPLVVLAVGAVVAGWSASRRVAHRAAADLEPLPPLPRAGRSREIRGGTRRTARMGAALEWALMLVAVARRGRRHPGWRGASTGGDRGLAQGEAWARALPGRAPRAGRTSTTSTSSTTPPWCAAPGALARGALRASTPASSTASGQRRRATSRCVTWRCSPASSTSYVVDGLVNLVGLRARPVVARVPAACRPAASRSYALVLAVGVLALVVRRRRCCGSQ